MADAKISALTSATTPLAGTEVVPLVQANTTKKVAIDDLTVKNVRSNATSGILQVAGPAAATTRVMTVPDANFTAARTDAAQTFTGNQTISNAVVTGGTVNGTTIGATTASSGKFTTIDASSPVVFKNTGSSGTATLQLFSGANTSLNSVYFPGSGSVNGVNGTPNSNGLMIIYQDSGNLRSISAAGSINALGADYAEYMTKSGDFVVAKGDVIGIDSNGKITQTFSEAVSFAVKSTNPGSVGGDIWFTEPHPVAPDALRGDVTAQQIEDYETAVTTYNMALAVWKSNMEEARKHVDRIAFCGKVPVNVMNAVPGQYVIPVNENGAIKGQTVNNPTFEQYMLAIGKVIAVEQDGRACIIVKIS